MDATPENAVLVMRKLAEHMLMDDQRHLHVPENADRHLRVALYGVMGYLQSAGEAEVVEFKDERGNVTHQAIRLKQVDPKP